jgi:hypothetical protein
VQPVLMRNLNSYSGKVRRRFRSKNSNPFEHRLSRIASSRFTNIEPGRHKRSIGAVTSNSSSRSHGRGSGGGRHWGRNNNHGGEWRLWWVASRYPMSPAQVEFLWGTFLHLPA